MYKTFNEIVLEQVRGFTVDDKHYFQLLDTEDKCIPLHHTYGRHIRNYYKLWDKNNPLTKAWFDARAAGSEEHMDRGVDCHPEHPDQLSMAIIKAIWRSIHSNTTTFNVTRKLNEEN
jgi:hypothetical protein